MGAWIETINNIGDTVLKKSHPVWVRGLKQACRDGLLPACVVAPRVGAWIETLLLCCVNICFAQNKLFDKYADMDDVTSVYISKKMFQMMPVMETAGLNLANLKGKIESLQILTTQKADLRERMRGEFKALIGKDHEELMRVKDGKTKANFYVKQQGELIQELIMIADMDDGSFSVMQLLGRFTLQDVQEITSEINK